MILYDYEYKNDIVIDKEEVYCAEVRRSIIESRTVERLEPQWDNDKYYLKSIEDNKVTFEDDMPNMKTYMNHNLLMQTIENIKRVE